MQQHGEQMLYYIASSSSIYTVTIFTYVPDSPLLVITLKRLFCMLCPRQTRSFFAEIFHHYNSRASAENLELIILTQNYLKLQSVSLENSLDHTYEVTNITGRTVIKVSIRCIYMQKFCAVNLRQKLSDILSCDNTV